MVPYLGLLLAFAGAVSSSPLQRNRYQFLTSCERKNNDGQCDLLCRNFAPGFESSDCSNSPMTTYNTTLTFEVVDISFADILLDGHQASDCQEWRQELGWRMREAMQVEVEVLISDKELHRVALKCAKSGGIILADFLFSITLPSCSSCLQINEILGRLSRYERELSEMEVRYVPKTDQDSTSTSVILSVIGVAALAFAAFSVIVPNTRKRKVESCPVWNIPRDEKAQPFRQYSVMMPQKPFNNQGFGHFNQNQYSYDQFLNSANTSPNDSFMQVSYAYPASSDISPRSLHSTGWRSEEDVLLQSRHAVQSQVTELHDLVCRGESEEQLVAEAERLVKECHVNIDAQNDDASTAVVLAVREMKSQLADRLLTLGANGNIPDSSGYSLFHHAVQNGDIRMLNTLVRHHSITKHIVNQRTDTSEPVKAIDELSNSGKTALMECALYSPQNIGRKMAEILLGAGANLLEQGDRGYRLNNADGSGKTVLHYAAEMGHDPLVNLIVEEAKERAFAAVDLPDYSSRTALFYACKNAHESTVRLLMRAGANQYIQAEPGCSPANVGNEAILRILEEYKGRARNVPINKPNKHGARKANEQKARERMQPMTPSSTSSSPSTTSLSPPSTTTSPQLPGHSPFYTPPYHAPFFDQMKTQAV